MIFLRLKIALALIVLFGTVFAAVYSPLLSVRMVKIAPESDIDRDKRKEIITFVDDIFAERMYGIPGRMRYLFKRNEVTAMLTEHFTEFRRIEVQYVFFNIWSVVGETRQPFGTICMQDACLLVDTDGTVYMRSKRSDAHIAQSTALSVREVPRVGEPLFIDRPETAARDFGTLVGVVEFLEENGLFVNQVAVRRDSRLAHIKLNNGIAIWMDASEKLYDTTRAIHIVFQEVLKDAGVRGGIISVDVRKPNSILYEERQ